MKRTLTQLGVVGFFTGHFLLASWLLETFGIGGLIGWGFGFFITTGVVYLYFEKEPRGPVD